MNINPNKLVKLQVPEFSEEKLLYNSNNVIGGFFTDKKNNVQDVRTPLCCLKKKVTEFAALTTRDSNAKDHAQRKKIVALLASVLVVALVASIALGIYFQITLVPHLVVALPIFTGISAFIVYATLVHLYSHVLWPGVDGESIYCNGPSHGGCPPGLIMPFIVGAFHPVFMELTSSWRYQRALTSLKLEINKHTETLKTFFREKYDKLLPVIEEDINLLKTELNAREKQSNFEAQRSEPKKQQLEALEMAKKDFGKIQKYLNKSPGDQVCKV